MGHELFFVDGISTIIYNRKNTGAVKKSSYIILFVLLVSAAGLSCRSSSTSPHKNRDRIIDAYKLPGPAFVQWIKLKEKWFGEVYRPALKKHGIRLNCSDCEYAYIRVVIHIDSEGRLFRIDRVKENICGKPAGEKLFRDFTDHFRKITFPLHLRGYSVRVTLGTGLKC